jgi:hypothetical protein
MSFPGNPTVLPTILVESRLEANSGPQSRAMSVSPVPDLRGAFGLRRVGVLV